MIKMTLYLRFSFLLLLLAAVRLNGQEKKWTLQECVDYAISNNIQLKRQKLQTDLARTDLDKSKMDILPSLNLGSNAQVSFRGRSIDPETNLITFEPTLSNSYSLNSTIDIFRGLATLNTIAANKFLLKAGFEQEKIARNNLIIDLMGQYYQLLYARGLERAAMLQLELSEKQLFRITKMVETGREALSKQYEIESKVSSDRLAFTIAQNNSIKALTSLRQLLQLEPDTPFDVYTPDPESIIISDRLISTDTVFKLASENLPRLRAIEYELKASEKSLAATRGMLFPSLSAGGGVTTGYYRVLGDVIPEPMPFSSQIKENNNQSLYLSLNIPIFNNYSTSRNIKAAKIRKSDNELRLELEKNVLYSEIENASSDFNRGRDEYRAAAANLEFNRKSFAAVEKKFESGLIDVTDYSASANGLFIAEAEVLRTRFLFLIRELTLRFYTTGEYENLFGK